MPTKTWVVGEEVLAADFNTYVQTQVVARFATVAARDAAWPAATAGPGAVSVTTDTGTIWQVVGSAWVSIGPRGRMAYTDVRSNVGPFTATTQILTVTFTADPARYYRTTIVGGLISTVTGDVGYLRIRNTAATMLQHLPLPALNAATAVVGTTSVVETGLSGSQTRTLSAERLSGTGNLTFNAGAQNPGFLLVEDIG